MVHSGDNQTGHGEGDDACAIAKAVRQPSGVWTLEVLEIFGPVTQGDEKALMRFAVNK